MGEHYAVAIVGSGPGGMSAGGRAAERGLSHILLEKTDHLSDTIYKYQKGKHVMATPNVLPLRSNMDFEEGKRETILGTWDRQTAEQKVNVRFRAEVTAIKGQKGAFELTINGSEKITADNVVLGIGLQGNLRKMGVPGEDWERVQYQLDDPDEYSDETIIVIGAGDAAIENAVALAKQNRVIIVNRGSEFARAKQGNLNLILDAIEKGLVDCMYSSAPTKMEPGQMTLKTAEGQAVVKCDRVIARLGAIPPRKFVESCGIVFPSADASALPQVSGKYESNVPGLYIIGALGGYPLIKQAMNQGYEVIEFILGNDIEPADEPLLKAKFEGLGDTSVADWLALIQRNVPILAGLTTLQLREFMIDSFVRAPRPGEVVFQRNDYSSTFFSIVKGSVEIQINPNNPREVVKLGRGEFFGEMGLIAGRRRTATVVAGEGCILVETPRRSMIKLIASVDAVKREMDRVALMRQIQTFIAPGISTTALAEVVASAKLQHFEAGEVLFNEGDVADSVHLIRIGSVTVSQRIAGRDIVVSYVPAGNYVGEMALITKGTRTATVRAAIATETVRLDGEAFTKLMDRAPDLKMDMENRFQDRIMQNVARQNRPEAGSIIQFLIEQGVGEATDVLLIDESLCVRCDNCEKACAETHGGISRLNREAGPTFSSIHVPTSCRHCEHPHCMTDCPADAIHRAPNGEVFIDDKCIGCSNCERNCPYGVIHMAYKAPKKPGLWSWLFFGRGNGPGEDPAAAHAHHEGAKTAVKCDMCKGIEGGATCVRACPTGAAIRVSPEKFFSVANLGS
ncbi:cyclic nucleotide-binding domain-containing protein [Zavarzinia sp. CC-PAN008]|uniref:cyclic nucleotide-binding domain-containing protein n=1 Tax=Zavarzinia sp. CC-PAN008 TaxID=3243332 RepID=UPI003F74A7F0